MATALGLGTTSLSSGIVRFVQGGVVKPFIVRTMLIENPYESPSHPGTPAKLFRWPWILLTLELIGRFGFWFGVFLILSGSFISFVPGVECRWFITAGLVTASGALVPKWRYRVAVIALCGLCFYWAYAGYVHGVEFEEWLKSGGTASQAESPHNMGFTLGLSAHLPILSTRAGLGTISVVQTSFASFSAVS